MNYFFNEKIYNTMGISEFTYPTIEFGSAVSGEGTPP
jgi:hypothetical protein